MSRINVESKSARGAVEGLLGSRPSFDLHSALGTPMRYRRGMADRPHRYRQLLDELVHQTREGQGTLAATRARSGVWNPNANPQSAPEQHNFNTLLSRMTSDDREIFAQMLANEFQRGVHTVLGTLHAAGVEPFEKGYQGTPGQDFMGRLGGWRWPQ
jgi:hypothetical protein